MDYTKFRLKPEQEIISVLKDKQNIVVLNCTKCFKEQDMNDQNECGELVPLLKKNNKKIIECIEIDFLCNRHQTEKLITKRTELIKDDITVIIYSCGFGIQAVTEIINKFSPKCEIYTVADTIPQDGHHGMALSIEKCDSCADCVLTYTGGICPVVNCSKGLLNGPCGGAKNGKCEISSDKDCAWEKIYNRLNSIGKIELGKQFFKIRKYSKPDYKTINNYNITIYEKRLQNFFGGVYPDENKEQTRNKQIIQFSIPKIVVLPLSQHTGAICEPLVKIGDKVYTGQKIGDIQSFISAPIHSPVTGKVVAIEPRKHPLIKKDVLSVVIESDNIDEYDVSVVPNNEWESLTKEELLNIIREKGIVGLGGAQFPTHVKLKSPKPIDTLVINGCECEPYLNSDYRIMVERPYSVIFGTLILMKILNVTKSYISIEDNKKEAIEIIKQKLDEFTNTNIEVIELKTKYPQGAERMLIKKLLGREIPIGGLPLDVGVVVNNVGTVSAVYDAVIKGLPLIRRVVTVTGENCINPGNYEIRLGTPIENVIDYCFGSEYKENNNKFILKMGGPMMGVEISGFDMPIIKGTTGLILLSKPDIEINLQRKCIKCGRCVDVCPMELFPLYFGLFTENKQYSEAEKYNVLSCIECGCCDYVCPSKRALVQSVKEIKKNLSVSKK